MRHLGRFTSSHHSQKKQVRQKIFAPPPANIYEGIRRKAERIEERDVAIGKTKCEPHALQARTTQSQLLTMSRMIIDGCILNLQACSWSLSSTKSLHSSAAAEGGGLAWHPPDSAPPAILSEPTSLSNPAAGEEGGRT